MEKTPYPVYLMWQRWLNEQLNKPDVHCYYLMRVAQRIHQVIRLLCRRDVDTVTLDMQKVIWEVPKAKVSQVSVEQKKEVETERAKMWFWGLLGGWRDNK